MTEGGNYVRKEWRQSQARSGTKEKGSSTTTHQRSAEEAFAGKQRNTNRKRRTEIRGIGILLFEPSCLEISVYLYRSASFGI
jgi:hypothetical protein